MYCVFLNPQYFKTCLLSITRVFRSCLYIQSCFYCICFLVVSVCQRLYTFSFFVQSISQEILIAEMPDWHRNTSRFNVIICNCMATDVTYNSNFHCYAVFLEGQISKNKQVRLVFKHSYYQYQSNYRYFFNILL